jgi:glycosyltransferase involved in cell wall biosynthesis
VTDVGSLRADVVEGETGLVCAPRDPEELARVVDVYFRSDLFKTLPETRDRIRDEMSARHSWTTVADITTDVYDGLTSGGGGGASRWLGTERPAGLRRDRE